MTLEKLVAFLQTWNNVSLIHTARYFLILIDLENTIHTAFGILIQ